MGDFLDEIGATGACGEPQIDISPKRKTLPELTAGQRIAAAYCDGLLAKEIAGKIDEAIREAREEAHKELGGLLFHDLARRLISRISVAADKSQSDWSDIELSLVRIIQKAEQLAAKEADCAAMREALEKITSPWSGCSAENYSARQVAHAALASNAGTDLLARLRAAEKAEIALAAVLREIAFYVPTLSSANPTPPDADGIFELKRKAADALAATQAARANKTV